MTRRSDVDPTESQGSLGGRKFSHPAYGVIRTSQASGSETTLFGTDFVHRNFVSLEICGALLERDLHRDQIVGGKVIIHVEMSEAQWAHFVSSHGKYEGTPVTIRYRPDPTAKLIEVPGIPHRVETNEFFGEAAKGIEDVDAQLSALEDLLAEDFAKLSKVDRDRALGRVRRARQQIKPNLEFVSEQMNKHLDKKVTDAKIEIYAWMNNAVLSAGLEALHGPIEVKPDIFLLEDAKK